MILFVDVILILAWLVAALIALTGGGTFELGARTLRLHSVGNLLLFICVLSVVRYHYRHHPFLGVMSFTLVHTGQRALAWLQGTRDWLDRPNNRAGIRALLGIIAATTVVKVALALLHPGFFSGDDVEIHEMTLGVAFREAWPVWDLRSAFYPMTFVFPVQRVLMFAGLDDVGVLVASGRLVVVCLSTVLLAVFFRWSRRSASNGTALVATVILATSALHVEFSATELPRAAATLFVVLAFFALATGRKAGAWMAGVSLAVAICMRFSEAIFVLPAVIQLAAERRYADGVRFAAAVAVVACGVQATSDLLYWGHPFHSTSAAIDFTLVQRLSSRGYDSPWYYVTRATAWTDLLVLALAIVATTRANWRTTLWCWLPVVQLSCLPHKEPRYLLPVLPFLALLAAHGFGIAATRLAALARGRPDMAGALAAAIVLAVPLRMLHQVNAYHIDRSDLAVRAARLLAPTLPSRPVVAEHAWRLGGHLYLGRGRSVRPAGPDDFAPMQLTAITANGSAGAVLVTDGTCRVHDCAAGLTAIGLTEVAMPVSASGYRLFVAADGPDVSTEVTARSSSEAGSPMD